MAFGDTGGAVTELIITCRSPKQGEVGIAQGDAVRLCGNYTVTNQPPDEEDDQVTVYPVFGEAMATVTENNASLPVKVRGISRFNYEGRTPKVDGMDGVLMGHDGAVRRCHIHQAVCSGIVVATDNVANTVDVLL